MNRKDKRMQTADWAPWRKDERAYRAGGLLERFGCSLQSWWPAIIAPFVMCGFALNGFSGSPPGSGQGAFYIRLFVFGGLLIFSAIGTGWLMAVSASLPPRWCSWRNWRGWIITPPLVAVVIAWALVVGETFDSFSRMVEATVFLLKTSPIPNL